MKSSTYSDCLSRALPEPRPPAARFDNPQPFNQALIEVGSVEAKMGMSVTVRAHPNDVTGAVRAAIGKTVHMVAFDIKTAVSASKWPRFPTVFTMPAGARQYIISYVAAPSKNTSLCWNTFRCGLCGFESSAPKLFDIDFVIWEDRFNVVDVDCDISCAAQFEDNRIADVVVFVWRWFVVVALVDHFSIIAQPAPDRSEEMDGLAILPGIDDSSISGPHFHRANLALTEILEDAIVSPPIGVAVPASFLTANNEDDRSVSRRDNAAALLTIIDPVDIGYTIVHLANYERHTILPLVWFSLVGCSPSLTVKEAA
jgi:hypothetical protein